MEINGDENVLHRAVNSGNVEMVSDMIRTGYRYNGGTPVQSWNLERVDANNNAVLMLAIKGYDVKMANLLLGFGANPNTTDGNNTPLIQAVEFMEVEIVQALIKAKAKLGACNFNHDTAFTVAQRESKKNIHRSPRDPFQIMTRILSVAHGCEPGVESVSENGSDETDEEMQLRESPGQRHGLQASSLYKLWVSQGRGPDVQPVQGNGSDRFRAEIQHYESPQRQHEVQPPDLYKCTCGETFRGTDSLFCHVEMIHKLRLSHKEKLKMAVRRKVRINNDMYATESDSDGDHVM